MKRLDAKRLAAGAGLALCVGAGLGGLVSTGDAGSRPGRPAATTAPEGAAPARRAKTASPSALRAPTPEPAAPAAPTDDAAAAPPSRSEDAANEENAGSDALERLEAALTRGDAEAVQAAEAALKRLGRSATPELKRLVAEGDGTRDLALLDRAARLLAEVEGPAAVATLTDRLEGASAPLARRLAHALSRIDDERARASLAHLVEQRPRVRHTAAVALAGSGRRGTARLIERLDPGSDDTTELVAALPRAADRAAATEALAEVATWDRPELRAAAVAASAELGEQARLLAATRDPAPAVRRVAAEALAARAGEPTAAEALARLVGDPDPEVRLQAVSGLDDAPARTAVPALARALSEEEGVEVRMQALAILGRLGGPRATALVRRHTVE